MRVTLCLFLLLTLASCEDEPTPTAIARPVSACQQRSFEGTNFRVCDPGTPAKLRLYAASADEQAPRSFMSLGLDGDAVAFAMNGGMFDEEGRPIGLAIVEGEQMKRINLRKRGFGNFHIQPNGVFLVRDDGTAAIVRSDGFEASDDIRLATQSGPMLVVDGKLNANISDDGPSRYIRNAVGVSKEGKALFVISRQSVSMGRLARFMRDELGTPNVLYLDGSVSSLWDPAGDQLDNFTPLGPIIVAMRP